MPFIEINGANLYYETFGKDTTGKAPIVLIHGSTGTGRSNWSLVAPLLARDYFVIVPDCRGHGKSSNPKRSYTFKEMAGDIAALVQALGYPRAHIIGHSNGGNVALVVLLEHPEVVQTAIPQAANAWVSPDLIEKEPPLFEPERVERESPAWKDEMVALHAETHGNDYWRDLLRMTVDEIIREPNYTPADLQAVSRPTLVIQGEQDRVNAPYKHAQFIARYIPDAELWIPKGIGHTVHDELLFEWVEKVLDFLKRRGDDDRDAAYRMGRSRYRDQRDWIYAVAAEPGEGDSRSIRLFGKVLRAEQRRAVADLFSGRPVEDRIQVLLKEETPWALAVHSVADLRREPYSRAERTSQVLLGEAVRILEDEGEWVRVRLEEDGYLGWMKAAALRRCEQEDVQAYQSAFTALVCTGIAPAFMHPDRSQEAGLLPFGVSVPLVDRMGEMAAIQLPDGQTWWVAASDLLPIDQRPHPGQAGFEQTLKILAGFRGVPYLWGGRTPFGYDCSGLAQAFLRFTGLRPPRDASQQFLRGQPFDGEPLPGDMLFFGEADEANLLPGEAPDPESHITHMAISLGGNDVIHATGAVDAVTYNSLDPASPIYRPWLKEHLVGMRRFS